MFKFIGLVAGLFIGSSLGVAGFGGAVAGWLIFGIMGLSLGANADRWLSNRNNKD